MVGKLTSRTDLSLKSEVLGALDDHGAIALGMSSLLTFAFPFVMYIQSRS